MTEEQIKSVLQDVDPETEVFIESIRGSINTRKGTIEYDTEHQILMFMSTVTKRFGTSDYRDVPVIVAIPYDQVSLIGIFTKPGTEETSTKKED